MAYGTFWDNFFNGNYEARGAEEMGINVLDVGHYAPEKYGLNCFGKLLDSKLTVRGYAVKIAYAKERDPFLQVP